MAAVNHYISPNSRDSSLCVGAGTVDYMGGGGGGNGTSDSLTGLSVYVKLSTHQTWCCSTNRIRRNERE